MEDGRPTTAEGESEHYWLTFSIAVILLLLYVASVAYLSYYRLCHLDAGVACEAVPPTSGVILAATTVNGLISALVVSVLAVTVPGANPATVLAAGATPTTYRKWSVNIYLVAWLVTGLWAFVIGSMITPEPMGTLQDIGQIWLGTAVASMYSYFGIKPAG